MVTDMERVADREKWWSIHDPEEYVCPDCKRTLEEHGTLWDVHHLDGVAGNCVGICAPCHQIRHGAEHKNVDIESWKAEFVGDNPEEHREDRTEARTSFTEVHNLS